MNKRIVSSISKKSTRKTNRKYIRKTNRKYRKTNRKYRKTNRKYRKTNRKKRTLRIGGSASDIKKYTAMAEEALHTYGEDSKHYRVIKQRLIDLKRENWDEHTGLNQLYYNKKFKLGTDLTIPDSRVVSASRLEDESSIENRHGIGIVDPTIYGLKNRIDGPTMSTTDEKKYPTEWWMLPPEARPPLYGEPEAVAGTTYSPPPLQPETPSPPWYKSKRVGRIVANLGRPGNSWQPAKEYDTQQKYNWRGNPV